MGFSLNDFLTLFSYIYILLRTKVHLLHLRVSNWLNLSLTVREIGKRKRTSNPVHSMVILGDSTALGHGDTGVSFGGTGGLGVGVLNCVFEARDVRRKWAVVNLGKVGGMLKDWVVEGGEGKEYSRVFGGDESSDKTTLVNVVNDSPIVIISLGMTDIIRGTHGFKIQALKRDPTGTQPVYPESELPDMVKDLRSLWRNVSARGKRVVIVGMLPGGAFLERFGSGKIRRINRMIEQQVKADNRKNKATPDVRYVGISGSLERSEMRSFDGLHLSRKGYNVLASEIFEVVRGDCVKAEFEVWKSMIGDLVPKGAMGEKMAEKKIVEKGFEVIDKVYTNGADGDDVALRRRNKNKSKKAN